VVAVNQIPGSQEKAAHRFCTVGWDMKTPRLVAQWCGQQAKARRLDAAIEANLKGLGYGKR
jgi:hypothetical protein